MKYSQALLVACVGSATLVAAAPTRSHTHSTPNSKSVRVGKTIGKGITYGGQFAQSATGSNSDNTNTDTERRELHGKTKERVRDAKRVGRTAVDTAGGGKRVAENLGSMVNLATTLKGSGETAPLNTRSSSPAAPPSAPDSSTPPSVSPLTSKPDSGAPHEGGVGHRKKLTPEEKKAKAQKWKNMSAEEKKRLKEKKKAKKGAKKGKKEERVAAPDATKSTSTSTPASPPESEATIDTRDFEDDLFTRDLVEELEARGFWDVYGRAVPAENALAAKPAPPKTSTTPETASNSEPPSSANSPPKKSGSRRPRKPLTPEQKKAKKERKEKNRKSKALHNGADITYSPKTNKSPTSSELDTREFDGVLYQRGFDDELVTRDFDDELLSRGFEDLAFTRDFFDDDLALRDVEGMVFSRDFEGDLVTRNKLTNAWGAFKDTVRGRKGGSSSSSIGVDPTLGTDATLSTRDFLEELDVRDFDIDELD